MKHIYSLVLSLVFVVGENLAQIPILNSAPSITDKVIYLDFDGQVVSGTLWNSGNAIYAAPSTLSSANKRVVWQRIAEDYRPFDVNITTDSVRFNNANPITRIRVVVTPTSAWYGSAGGVAYLGSFTWGGTPGTPCWIFENQLGYNTKSVAEAAAHEVGHTLTLKHQSTYDGQCNKTNEYNPGVGSGITAWAPIMGVGYNKNVTIWHNGTNATNCNTLQYDHSNSGMGITSPGFLNFLADDVGDNLANAKILNLTTLLSSDSGIITTPTDVDAYRFTICNNRYVSINAKPWALDTSGYNGADLDIKLKLYNSSGTILTADSSLSKLAALAGMNLTAGTYFFTIDGGNSSYYSDYGSLGKYYLSIKATNPPALANTIVTPSVICSSQNVVLSYNSNGVPNTWQWTVSGPVTSSFTIANPTMNFNTAGIYSISLLATGTNSTSCIVTKTLNIGVLPNISIAGTSTVLCPLKSGSLSASGAQSYTWLPGNFGGTSQIVNPTTTTTYTVLGSNGTCINSAVATLTVNPAFNLQLNASSNNICSGQSVTLTASGATTYTFYPGALSLTTTVITPTYNTSYTVFASDGMCTKSKATTVLVTGPINLNVYVTDTLVCAGATITIYGSMNGPYTLQPGGTTGNPISFNPLANNVYTLSLTGPNQCVSDTLINVFAKDCNYVGLNSESFTQNIRVFPNPVSDKFFVASDDVRFQLKVYNLLGTCIWEESNVSNTKEIETLNWPPGVYIVRILSSDQKTHTLKLVKE